MNRKLTLPTLLSATVLATQASAQTTLTFWDLLGGGDGARMKELVDGFNKSQNQYVIKRTTLAWGVPYLRRRGSGARFGHFAPLAPERLGTGQDFAAHRASRTE